MSQQSSNLPWHPIPLSPSNAICKVHLIQAGGLILPEDLVLLPGPNKPNSSLDPDRKDEPKKWYAPDYVFLIEHVATGNHYIFDLGMRKDLHNLPPYLIKNVLPSFDCSPASPAEILKEHGNAKQQPEYIKAVMFSHMHFDHVGDGAKAGFTNPELWVGPTCCTYARPGYPVDENGVVLSDNLPSDGSRKIVEPFVPDEVLKKAGDKREGKVKQAQEKGLYEAVELKKVEWIGLGAFDRAFDVFGDGSAYLLDAPGHSPGHQMILVRVKSSSSFSSSNDDDDFVLLAGDCYHHPALLKEPERTAREPYSKGGMHADPETAVETMMRTKAFAEKDNVWVTGAHDFTVGEAIAKGEKEIKGLVRLNEWHEKEWK